MYFINLNYVLCTKEKNNHNDDVYCIEYVYTRTTQFTVDDDV